MTEPRTDAGRALLDALPLDDWHPVNRSIVVEHILAIEAQAAAIDVARLAGALRSHTLAYSIRLDGTWEWWANSPSAFAEQILGEYVRLPEEREP